MRCPRAVRRHYPILCLLADGGDGRRQTVDGAQLSPRLRLLSAAVVYCAGAVVLSVRAVGGSGCTRGPVSPVRCLLMAVSLQCCTSRRPRRAATMKESCSLARSAMHGGSTWPNLSRYVRLPARCSSAAVHVVPYVSPRALFRHGGRISSLSLPEPASALAAVRAVAAMAPVCGLPTQVPEGFQPGARARALAASPRGSCLSVQSASTPAAAASGHGAVLHTPGKCCCRRSPSRFYRTR